MSVFGKLFGAGGGKAGKGGPTPQDAIQRLRDTEEMLSKKQEFLETKIEQELTAAKKHGTKNKRGESAQSPQTLLRLPSGSPGPGLHLRQTHPRVCPDPGTLPGQTPLEAFLDSSPSSFLEYLPGPRTPPPSDSFLPSPLCPPHSARPLPTLVSLLPPVLPVVRSLPPSPLSGLPSPTFGKLPSFSYWLISAPHPNSCVLPCPTPAFS